MTKTRPWAWGVALGVALAPHVPAQTAQGTSFTYQGRLTEAGAPVSGPYDVQFSLYDAAAGGSQVAPVVTREDVVVTAGLFTVGLDFGTAFTGDLRFLELAVRPGDSTGSFVSISPRQELTSAPAALFSATAPWTGVSAKPAGFADDIDDDSGGTVTSVTAGPGLTGGPITSTGSLAVEFGGTGGAGTVARSDHDHDTAYVGNTTTPQAAVNFNIGGTGKAAVLEVATQFNLGGARILGEAGVNNLFAGIGAGQVNTGIDNSFFGRNAGGNNTGGNLNSFFGSRAGLGTTSGLHNSFFGAVAGFFNTTGSDNSIFGSNAGVQNVTGSQNSFFGSQAGRANTTGTSNSFFGSGAGFNNTTAHFNSFFGYGAGASNMTGQNNTFIGHDAGRNTTVGFGNSFIGQAAGEANVSGSQNTVVGWSASVGSILSNATAIGANAFVVQSNSLVLGSISSVNGATSNTNVGIGTLAPAARLHIVDGSHILFGGSPGCPGRGGIVFASSVSATCENYSLLGGDGSTYVNRPNGGAVFFREGNVNQVTIKTGGVVSLLNLGTAGSQALCRNGSGDISTCSSSVRYKTDVRSFGAGLDVVGRLRPVSFAWRDSGKRDVGLIAEEVARVEPLLSTTNEDGQIEGVNYGQLNVVLINAIKEQQAQIRTQGEELKRLHEQVGALATSVCR